VDSHPLIPLTQEALLVLLLQLVRAHPSLAGRPGDSVRNFLSERGFPLPSATATADGARMSPGGGLGGGTVLLGSPIVLGAGRRGRAISGVVARSLF